MATKTHPITREAIEENLALMHHEISMAQLYYSRKKPLKATDHIHACETLAAATKLMMMGKEPRP